MARGDAMRFAFRAAWVYWLAALLGLVVPAAATAQAIGTVTGRVTDGQTGEPLIGARIAVAGSISGTVTRANGSYRLSLPAGRYEVRVSAIGYGLTRAQVTVPAGGTVTQDLALARAPVALEELAVTGTRAPERTSVESPVPVDVLTEAEIKSSGRTETAQIIQMLAPSFNFPRTSIADGTDHTRPATLRGLAPDQVLVLVNGKRRHVSALINVNGTVGRGSGMVDLNAIPASAIDRIEILRDGAAAQYGSDAIAGVINIILKANAANEIAGTAGTTTEGDGEVAQGALSYAVSLGGRGFLQLSGEYRSRNPTNRSGLDVRQQYLAGDPRNSNPPRRTSWQGDGDILDRVAFFNGAYNPGGSLEVYGFGGYGVRDGNAWGFFRRPLDDRTVRAIHPDGFLPQIHTDILDASGVAGVRGAWQGWRWDLSANGGVNGFTFQVRNSNNVTLGASSPTEFDAGKLQAALLSFNLDAVKPFDVGLATPLNVAFGAEYRRDYYEITAGEPASYIDGGVRILDGPNAGAQGAVGAQVFPGFQPGNAVDVGRNNVGAYLDLETRFTDRLLVGAAARWEDYSDFGSELTGKLAARVDLTAAVALRGAVSNGFRAPSLGQSWFSSTATNFIAGVPFENRTFPVADPIAQALGAQPLRAETSVNLSAGLTLEPMQNLSVTADYYRITIDDRIVLSGNFTQPAVRQFLESQGFTGVSGARFFTNAVDTRTHGVDVVLGYATAIGTTSTLRLTGGFNVTDTKVTRVTPTPGVLAQFSQTLFDSVELVRMERGQPKNNLNLTGSYAFRDLTVNARAQRYGEFFVQSASANRDEDQEFGAKWVADLSVGYRFLGRLTATIGADNLFNTYPDRFAIPPEPSPTVGGSAFFGINPYSGQTPFGFNGRYVYTRLSLTF
jgi:iron complex outermembrane recepter protein